MQSKKERGAPLLAHSMSMKKQFNGFQRFLCWTALGLLSACGTPVQPPPSEYPAGRARLALPPGDWVDLGQSDEALPLQPELLPDPNAHIDLQTRAVGLRGKRSDGNSDWLAVILVQTNRTRLPHHPHHNPILWTSPCPLQKDVFVANAGGPVRIDCLRFQRWANNTENWLGKNHPALAQWLTTHHAAPSQSYSHLHYRYTSDAGAYTEVNAFVDQRLLVPATHNNDGFLRSGEPAQAWMHQIRQAVRQSTSMLDGYLRIPPFPLPLPLPPITTPIPPI